MTTLASAIPSRRSRAAAETSANVLRPSPSIAVRADAAAASISAAARSRRANACSALLNIPRLDRNSAVVALTRSEEHTSELQSLMRISYAVFCLKKKKQQKDQNN